MAEKHIANAEASWHAVCVTPDVCKVGKKLIPFDSFRDLSHDKVASPDVNARGTPVYRISDWLQGTESNAGHGVASGTSGAQGHVQMLADNTTVRVNGLICARHETVVLMNNANTVGKLETDQGAPLGVAENGKLPCNDPPKTSPALEELEALKERLAFMDPDQLDQWIRFGDAHETLDGLISGIEVAVDGDYGRLEGGARWVGDKAAQVARGALGFGKDAGLGVGQLVYGAAKMVTPAGMIHASLDARILAEHIKLGNICLESLKQAAAATGQELAKPVTDAWESGDHVEAVTRAGLEVGTLVVAIVKVAKASTATRAAGATTAAGAAGAADDVARAGAKPAGPADDVAKAADASEGSNGVVILSRGISLDNTRAIKSTDANRGFEKPPYKDGADVIEGTLLEDAKFVRLYDGDNSGQLGRWIMPESEITGLTPKQLADKFALPQTPNMITDVYVPSGTIIRYGEAGRIPGWGNGGGIQIQLMDRIPSGNYGNPRPIL